MESVWKAMRKGRTLLVTVRSTVLTSALKVPPQILSSHVANGGWRSAILAQGINIQSFVHELGVAWVPPPTMELTGVLELPESVKERVRLLAEKKDTIIQKL